MPVTNGPLLGALVDIDRHVGHAGWDQPARLFALVPTAQLLDAEPSLRESLGGGETREGALSSIEQDGFHAADDLLTDLERIAWPDAVFGCALAVERLFLPSDAEAELPEDPDAAAVMVASHPRRQDVRVIVGVTRDGARHSLARLKDQPDELLGGDDLVPGLSSALARTLQ